MLKKIITAIIISTLSVSFIGCSDTTTTVEATDNKQIVQQQEEVDKKEESEGIKESIQQLNSSKEISIEEKIFSFNKSYNILVDGEEFGTISGKYINFTGDVFTLTTKHGLNIASEKQVKRWGVKLNRLAEVYDAEGNVTGYIGEEKIEDFFKIGYKFHFYDKDKNELGYIKKQYFSLLDHFDVYNMKDEVVYKVDKDLTFMADKYTISVIDNSEIPTDQVVFVTAIMQAIQSAQKESE